MSAGEDDCSRNGDVDAFLSSCAGSGGEAYGADGAVLEGPRHAMRLQPPHPRHRLGRPPAKVGRPPTSPANRFCLAVRSASDMAPEFLLSARITFLGNLIPNSSPKKFEKWCPSKILKPDPEAMSKIITENLSEEFLYSLICYYALQVCSCP
ncbi:hypothetical protein ZWY2020_041495 [Hordeum vulgare]|nr:hypothetical protein ZWY2020_041495 [Hordeum vulgare]